MAVISDSDSDADGSCYSDFLWPERYVMITCSDQFFRTFILDSSLMF